MPKPSRLATFLLLGLFVAAAGATDVTVRQFVSEVQPVLNPKLTSWVATQTGIATRSSVALDMAALRSSAAAALGTGKATPENMEVLVGLVMAEMYKDAEQDIRQIADEIDRNVTLKKQLHDAMALLRESDTTALTELLDANPTLISMRQKRLDEIRRALDDARPLQGVNLDLALALQLAVTRASQAMQQLAAILAVYSRSGATIIGNIRG